MVESVQGAGWFVAGTGDRRPLVERVTDLLRGEGVKVGDRFPTEKKLCERFGASRTAVRSAIAQMEGQGLIGKGAGRGREVLTLPAGRTGGADGTTTTERMEFDADAAEAILRRACAVADLEPDGIEILRLGDHAVFRVDGGRIIARVGRGADRLTSVRREVAVTRWLADQGYPAAHLVTDAEPPIVIEDQPVTFWV